MPIRRLEKTYTGTTSTIGGDEIAASTIPVKPHIQPGVLQPAVAGKLLDGTTNHSGAYGTAQSDGHSYYYTDIKGSKSIKDPRIGAHFGSQRHTISSLQLLKQETALQGKKVYSVDGREWFKAVDGTGTWRINNSSDGVSITSDASNNCTGIFLEITGYFNDFNIAVNTATDNANDIDISVNGTLSVDGSTTLGGDVSAGGTPLGGRYVNRGSFINGGSTLSASLGTTPTINTLRYECKTGSSQYIYVYAIELIAQDTTSTANKSKIQIPSQNVVSYGKKFTVSGTPHYNPFAQSQTGSAVTINSSTTNTAKLTGGWSGTGATYYSSELDTATSLGLAAWVSGGEYFRPVNGGRIIWWVNSSGALKCSVNMMPPAGTAIGGTTSGHNVPTGVHNWATKYQSALHSTTIDHSQAEIAKTFYWIEFGNGAANAGSNHSASWQDATMMRAQQDDLSYVMDDGLTSMSMYQMQKDTSTLMPGASTANAVMFYNFIGTGFSLSNASNVHHVIAQNLPYGSHSYRADWSGNSLRIYLDGAEVKASQNGQEFKEVYIYQPKKPPIPEDAVVLADYMLMADFVPQSTAGSNDAKQMSKGVRSVSVSRDVYCNSTDNNTLTLSQNAVSQNHGFNLYTHNGDADSDTSVKIRLPSFSTNYLARGFDTDGRLKLFTDDTDKDSSSTKVGSHYGACSYLTNDVTLGVNNFGANFASGTNGSLASFEMVTPTHTSSHYQSFETPYLKELVGGDRNMEQNNLIVTSDGKSWDEVTRDTSYLGKKVVHAGYYAGNGSANPLIIDEWRGHTDYKNLFNKDWAISYDRWICLVDGQYTISFHAYSHTTGMYFYCNKNAVTTSGNNYDMLMYALMTAQDTTIDSHVTEYFVRGDWIQFGCSAGNLDGVGRTWFEIERI